MATHVSSLVIYQPHKITINRGLNHQQKALLYLYLLYLYHLPYRADNKDAKNSQKSQLMFGNCKRQNIENYQILHLSVKAYQANVCFLFQGVFHLAHRESQRVTY